MESEGLLPFLQAPDISPCPEPDQSSSCPPAHFLKTTLILSSHLRLGLPSGPFSEFSPSKSSMHLSSPSIPATCPSHLILDLITRMIFGEDIIYSIAKHRSVSTAQWRRIVHLCSALNTS